MSELTPSDFASAVAAAISGVHHLYREVDRLLVELRGALNEEPNPLKPLLGSSAKSGVTSKRTVMRDEFGLLFGDAAAEEDPVDDEDEPEEEAEEGEHPEPRRRRRPTEIASDSRLLAVRIAMYERSALYDTREQDAFVPRVEFAVMDQWAVSEAPWAPQQQFLLAGYMLRRIPRALGACTGASEGKRIPTGATVKRAVGPKKLAGRQLSCRLPFGVRDRALYTLNDADALDGLAKAMKEMWAGTVKLQT